jgi:hypothetical protein
MRKTAWFATVLVLVVLVVMTVARFVRSDLRWPILLASFSAYALVGFVVVLIGCALVVRRSRHPAVGRSGGGGGPGRAGLGAGAVRRRGSGQRAPA